jgi:hypothetical protein
VHTNSHKQLPTKCAIVAFQNTMAEDEYYQLFDEETNEGKVLDDDWSKSKWENETPPTDTLTESEADKRSAYSITIKKLQNI